MAEDETTTETTTQEPQAADMRASDAETTAGATTIDSAAEASALTQRIAALEAELTREHEAATDYMNRWQRAQADFSNFKRRAQQEQEQIEALTAGRVIASLLPAVDSFERAFATLPPTLRAYSWIDGVALVHLQVLNAFNANGVQAIETTPGQPFDPKVHQAIGEVETDEHPAGHVAVVVQRGYEARGMLIR
ncbi:MAG TPA: nucleotide exchange factor GrpE, partial [Ktedonobacterales bacterium]|nr:nucleotide exchange factor GrpE [Ktedonobacterales bacterium]